WSSRRCTICGAGSGAASAPMVTAAPRATIERTGAWTACSMIKAYASLSTVPGLLARRPLARRVESENPADAPEQILLRGLVPLLALLVALAARRCQRHAPVDEHLGDLLGNLRRFLEDLLERVLVH